jgi:eukaryotic-like serine/threonine-protein kinase
VDDHPPFTESEEDTEVLSEFMSGSFFADRYRMGKLLGTGAMGKVFRALDLRNERVVALKVLHADKARKEQVLARFRREAAILMEVGHPGIVDVIDSGRAPDGTEYLVMELLEGQTLRERIRSEKGTLSAQELLPLIVAVADALGAAHQKGVVHRDLKPDNIFLLSDDKSVKVLDFGLSMLDTDKRMTKTGVMLGTPRYMAPEQIRSAKDVDPRVDIYALGVSAHEALTGSSPFPAEDAGQLLGCVMEGRIKRIEDERPDLPPGLGDVIRRAMHKDRGQRYATMGNFAEAFARTLGVAVIKNRTSVVGLEDPNLRAHTMTLEPIGDEGMPGPKEKPRFTKPEVSSPGAAVAQPQAPAPEKRRSAAPIALAIFVVLVVCVACVAAAAAFGLRGLIDGIG